MAIHPRLSPTSQIMEKEIADKSIHIIDDDKNTEVNKGHI